MQNTKLPTLDTFYSKLCSCNRVEVEYTDYVDLLKSGLTTRWDVFKLKLSKPLYAYWDWELSIFAKDMEAGTNEVIRRILRWFNKKDVAPNFDATQKKIAFYYDKDIKILKLRYTLPNLANICPQKSAYAKFYAFTEKDEKLLEKHQEKIVGGPSINLHARQLLMKLFLKTNKTIQICCWDWQ